MIQTKPEINPKLHYQKSSVSRILQVTRPTLDRAEKNKELIATKHPNKHVTYLGADVLNYWETKRY